MDVSEQGFIIIVTFTKKIDMRQPVLKNLLMLVIYVLFTNNGHSQNLTGFTFSQESEITPKVSFNNSSFGRKGNPASSQLFTQSVITVSKSICFGDSLFAGGTFRRTSGNYYDTLKSGTDDSVIITELTVMKPVADFTCANCDGCEPLQPILSSLPSGFPVSYNWSINGVVRSNDSIMMLSIVKWGTYRVQLRVTTSNGCSSISLAQNIKVHAIPFVAFASDPPVTTIANPFFNFINQSYSADGSYLSTYLWNLGPETNGGPDRFSAAKDPHDIGYSSPGTKCITLTTTTEFGCLDSITDCVRISDLGIKDNFVHVYPNPVKDELTVYFENKCTGTLSLYNALGQLMLEENVDAKTISINTTKLSNGIYLVVMITSVGSRTVKIIKV